MHPPCASRRRLKANENAHRDACDAGPVLLPGGVVGEQPAAVDALGSMSLPGWQSAARPFTAPRVG